MKNFLSILISLSLILPPLNQTLSAQEITNQSQLSMLTKKTFYTQELSEVDQLSTTLAMTPSQTVPEMASPILSPTSQTSATNSIVEKPTPHFASTLTHTLASIFNVLATLVQSSSSEQTTHLSLSTLLESIFTLVEQTSNKKGVELDLFIHDLKKECRQSLTNTIELSTNDTLNDYKRPSKNEEKEAKTQAALCNVATIVSGVANIVQEPHDKVSVGQNVGSILTGIINIALLASHKPRQQTLHYLTENLNVE